MEIFSEQTHQSVFFRRDRNDWRTVPVSTYAQQQQQLRRYSYMLCMCTFVCTYEIVNLGGRRLGHMNHTFFKGFALWAANRLAAIILKRNYIREILQCTLYANHDLKYRLNDDNRFLNLRGYLKIFISISNVQTSP